MFSLGCVLYRLGTGVVPFPGDTMMAVMRSLAVDEPKPPSEVNSELPLELSQLILRLLVKDRNARPASARALADTLQEIEHNRTARLPAPGEPAPTKSAPPAGGRVSPAPRWVPWLAAAVVLAGLLGGGAWLLSG